MTDGIPAWLSGVVKAPVLRADRTRRPVSKKAAASAAGVIIPASMGAAFLTCYGGFLVLFLLAFTGFVVTSRS